MYQPAGYRGAQPVSSDDGCNLFKDASSHYLAPPRNSWGGRNTIHSYRLSLSVDIDQAGPRLNIELKSGKGPDALMVEDLEGAAWYSLLCLLQNPYVVLGCIYRLKSLDILARCAYRVDEVEWPSWVPHFDIPHHTHDLPLSVISGHSAAAVQKVGRHVLKVVGKRVDRVKQVIKLPTTESMTFSDQAISGFLTILVSNSGLGDNSVIDTCCQIIYGFLGAIYSNIDPELLDWLNRSISASGESSEPINSRFLLLQREAERFPRTFYNRSFIVTDLNYVGLAPGTVAVGDEGCVLLGCNFPILLRASDDANHKIIGESFVLGLRYAEGLLGPLSDGWRAVLVTRADNNLWFSLAYRNGESEKEKSTVNDPRSGALPCGWETVRHSGEESFAIYRNIETGKEKYFDPRLSPDELRKLGIVLQTFNFI